VEVTTGHAPSHGLIRYDDATVRIDYTDALRSELLALMAEIRVAFGGSDVERSHNQPERCWDCGFAHACDQRLMEGGYEGERE